MKGFILFFFLFFSPQLKMLVERHLIIKLPGVTLNLLQRLVCTNRL